MSSWAPFLALSLTVPTSRRSTLTVASSCSPRTRAAITDPSWGEGFSFLVERVRDLSEVLDAAGRVRMNEEDGKNADPS
jgi:hypothetical protein